MSIRENETGTEIRFMSLRTEIKFSFLLFSSNLTLLYYISKIYFILLLIKKSAYRRHNVTQS
jgi:hypothetical protein